MTRYKPIQSTPEARSVLCRAGGSLIFAYRQRSVWRTVRDKVVPEPEGWLDLDNLTSHEK